MLPPKEPNEPGKETTDRGKRQTNTGKEMLPSIASRIGSPERPASTPLASRMSSRQSAGCGDLGMLAHDPVEPFPLQAVLKGEALGALIQIFQAHPLKQASKLIGEAAGYKDLEHVAVQVPGRVPSGRVRLGRSGGVLVDPSDQRLHERVELLVWVPAPGDRKSVV